MFSKLKDNLMSKIPQGSIHANSKPSFSGLMSLKPTSSFASTLGDSKGITHKVRPSLLTREKKIDPTKDGIFDSISDASDNIGGIGDNIEGILNDVSNFELPTVETNNSLDTKSLFIFRAIGVRLIVLWKKMN